MYFTNWDRFVQSCSTLCDQASTQSSRRVFCQPRYCLRWRHSQGLLVIKVTDDVRCIKFKTRSTVYLNRFDAFNRAMMTRFQNRKSDKVVPTVAAPSATATPPSGESATTSAVPGADDGGQGATATPKKKKKGKKKAKA
ncbi:hypothetical protein JCM11491_000048 [Sporobolomyces phaffii]